MCRSSFTCFFWNRRHFYRSVVGQFGRAQLAPASWSINPCPLCKKSHRPCWWPQERLEQKWLYILQQTKRKSPKKVFFWLDIYLLNTNIYIYYLNIYIYHINIIIRLTGLWCIYLSRRTHIFFFAGVWVHTKWVTKNKPSIHDELAHFYEHSSSSPNCFFRPQWKSFFLNSRSENSRLSAGGYLIEVHPLPWFELSVNLYLMLWWCKSFATGEDEPHELLFFFVYFCRITLASWTKPRIRFKDKVVAWWDLW